MKGWFVVCLQSVCERDGPCLKTDRRIKKFIKNQQRQEQYCVTTAGAVLYFIVVVLCLKRIFPFFLWLSVWDLFSSFLFRILLVRGICKNMIVIALMVVQYMSGGLKMNTGGKLFKCLGCNEKGKINFQGN